MDRQTAQQILNSFDFKTMEVLEKWVDYRISTLRYATESLSADEKTIRFAQGGIDELKLLKKMRSFAESVIGE